ncbi:MAG: 4a-hydroxytetrahydrobiopterin dehydratase [Bacteriovoracia bacterium]
MELQAEWQIEATSLKRDYKFKNFREALAFTNAIGAVAENHKHHPDIELGWGYVRLKITTHDKGNQLSEKDYKLAKAIDQLSLA